jgi:hypothetical protein
VVAKVGHTAVLESIYEEMRAQRKSYYCIRPRPVIHGT